MNLSGELSEVSEELQDVEEERDVLTAKLDEKEKELADTQKRADLGDEELGRERERIRRLHEGIGVIGQCLSGVLESLSASGSGDDGRAVLVLLTVVDSCKASEKILAEVQAFQSSSSSSSTPQGSFSSTAYR